VCYCSLHTHTHTHTSRTHTVENVDRRVCKHVYVTYLRICENVARYRFSFHGVTLTVPHPGQPPATPTTHNYTMPSQGQQQQQHASIAHHIHAPLLFRPANRFCSPAGCLCLFVYIEQHKRTKLICKTRPAHTTLPCHPYAP